MSSTNFDSGITNAPKASTAGNLGHLDPTQWHTYFNDFDTYVAGEWTITTTEGGAGSATEALADVDGGGLLVTNAAGDNDLDFFNKVGESFTFVTGKKLVFKARFSVSDATQSDFVIGLQIKDTTMLAVSDGVYFQKDDGDANLDFHVTGSSTSTSVTGVHTMVDATYVIVGFYYDGVDAITYFIDDVRIGQSVTTNMPSTELTVAFGLQNGEAVAKTLSLDYILASKER